MSNLKCTHCGREFRAGASAKQGWGNTLLGGAAMVKNIATSAGTNFLKPSGDAVTCPHCHGTMNVCPGPSCGRLIAVHAGDMGSVVNCPHCKYRFVANQVGQG
jgi:DNA-directed RNA polymerase subunit RPC12/RpoP